jgi:uncharacterized protein (UPF0333 family)
MGILKVFSLLSIVAAIIIGAYLYVSHIKSSPAATNTTSAAKSAGDAVDNFNNQSQKLQDAASQIGQ